MLMSAIRRLARRPGVQFAVSVAVAVAAASGTLVLFFWDIRHHADHTLDSLLGSLSLVAVGIAWHRGEVFARARSARVRGWRNGLPQPEEEEEAKPGDDSS